MHKKDISTNKKAIRRLRLACEDAKKALKHRSSKYPMHIDALIDEEDFDFIITRDTFETRCNDLFEKCVEPVDVAMRNAK